MHGICEGLEDLRMWGRAATVNGHEIDATGVLNQGVKMRIVHGGTVCVGDVIAVINNYDDTALPVV